MRTEGWRIYVVLWLSVLTVVIAAIGVRVAEMSKTQDALWEQTVEASTKANVALDLIEHVSDGMEFNTKSVVALLDTVDLISDWVTDLQDYVLNGKKDG